MRKKILFNGCCTALVTPFDKSGNINYFKLKELIEFQIANNVSAILILGTTGESSTISREERNKITKFASSIICNRVPLVVGCGSNSTKTAISLVNDAQNNGADAVLIVSPYYNKTNQNGIVLHYKEISKNTNIPIIVYNVPSRTGLNILPETMLKIAKLKNIVAIKEASGNMAQVSKLCQILPSSVAVYSGDDGLTLPAISVGAKGVISVVSNAYPEKVQMLCDFAFQGDYFNARKLHRYLFDINNAAFLDVNPICIKEYMNMLGFDVGETRLPLCRPNKKIVSKLKKVRDKYEG